jgi:hypothetical protein
MPLRIAQVRAQASYPGSRIRKLRIAQMPGCELRASRRPVAHVETDDRIGNRVSAQSAHTAHELCSQPRSAESFDVKA